MPGFDRTGPEGKGPRTGRGMGQCNPKTPKGQNTGRGFGRGFFGRGAGRGFGRGSRPSVNEK